MKRSRKKEKGRIVPAFAPKLSSGLLLFALYKAKSFNYVHSIKWLSDTGRANQPSLDKGFIRLLFSMLTCALFLIDAANLGVT